MLRPAAAIITASVLIGCQGSASAPRIAQSASYDGPPISLGSTNGSHVVTVEAPSAGWQVSRDRIREAKGYSQVFVTLREPDPRFTYAQVIVEQNILTSIPESADVRVYARVLPGGDTKVTDGEYRPVQTASTISSGAASGSR